MKKKVLAWMLSVFMVVTMMPLPAFANTVDTGDQNINQTEISQEEEVLPETPAEETEDTGGEGDYGIAPAAETTNVAKVGNTEYATIAEAIEAAQAGDIVNIIADEIAFEENAASIVIDKAITIKGAGKDATTLTFNSAASAFIVKSSDVTFENLKIVQGTKDNSFHISIYKGAWDAPAIQYSDIAINNVAFVGGDYSLCLIGEDVVVDNCTFTDQDSHNIIVYSLKGDSKIINNTFNASKGNNKSAILWEGGADNATDISKFIGGGSLTIEGNTANSKGVFFQFTNWKLVKDMKVAITDNTVDAFTNKAIALYDMDGAVTAAGDEFASFVVNENVFTKVPDERPILKEYTGKVVVDASANYLGSEEPNYSALLVGDKVAVDSYYSDEGKTNLVDLRVAQIGDKKYTSFQAAIDAAQAGDTITLLADITEDVTVDKAVTIDGAEKTYTGKMTLKADTTIKNVNFDGKGYNGYAIETRGANYLTVEDCTAKNYGYGFIQLASGTALTTVKNVTISDMNYGVKVDYSNAVVLENVDIDAAVAGVLNSNYGEKTITIKDSKISILGTWTRNNTTKTTYVFEGANTIDEFIIDAAIDNFKLTVGATLEAPEGINPTTDADYHVKYIDGKYTVVDYESGTWGGIDWKLTKDGTLTIAPTKGTPVADENSGKTYEVGEWREAVRYNSSGEGVAIEGWPYDRTKVKTLVIEEGVTSIGSFTAQGFTNLTGEVVIPPTVTYIGQEAFQKSTMTKLTFAEGGTEELCIAQGAFKNLIIEEVALPADRPVHLHAWVFNNCHNLKSATLPATLVSVHGTNHIDYFKDFNAHSNPTWTKSSEIFAYDENLETITFGSEEVRDMFFANNNGTSKDYTVANVGLTTYCDLQDAVDAAQNEETVKLIKNVTLADTLTVPADKKITLDLNGKTISQTKECTAHYTMIENKGDLTITGNGKISFTDIGAGDPNFGWGSYTLVNRGNLVVENGTIENKSQQNKESVVHMYCAIQQAGGTVTIKDGTITTAYYRSVRVNKGDLIIKGGTFNGQVWLQPNQGDATIKVEGGTFAPAGVDGSSIFLTNKGESHTVASATISGGTFTTKIGATDAAALAGIITGGTFTEAAKNGTNAALLAAGYVFEKNADDTYGVVCGLKGSGTAEAPFLIEDVEDLIFFRDSVNAGETVFNADGVYVRLEDNIDLAGENWSNNIGDDCNYTFDGIFDGNNKTIKNLTIKETAPKADGYICTGLFGAIGGNAVIKNLTIKNVEIDTGNFTGNNVAAVVGFALAATGSVEDVTVKGDIIINAKEVDGVGAIVGYSYEGKLTIKNCVVEGNSDSVVDGRAYVGGIIGYAGGKTTIEDCIVEDLTVNANSCCAAGIAGILLNGGVATGNTVEEATMTAAHKNWQNSAAIVVGAITGPITVAETTYDDVNTDLLVGCVHANKPTTPVARVQAAIGNVYYPTFDDAYAAAETGDTITLFAPVVVNAGETLTLNKAVTIEYTSNEPGEDMFTNKGTMVVDGTTLVYVNTDTTANNVTVSTISTEPGSILEVKSGVVKNDSANNAAKGIYAYAIDILTNGSLGDVTATISGGEVISTNYMAIRQFVNGDVCKNSLTVTNGTIVGGTRGINIQLKNNMAYTTISGGHIEGGDYSLCALTTSENLSVTGGTFVGPVWYSGTTGFIKGGTYDTEVEAAYCVEGFIPYDNRNGTYTVIEDVAYGKVAQVGSEYFPTLAAAIEAAQSGDTITFLADITENVTVNKNVTIDGADFNYTGKMTLNKVDVTVKNVDFVKGTIYKNKNTGVGGNYTIKNCDFDGQGINDYAVNLGGTGSIVIENCTAKNYGYGFLQVPSSNTSVSVKNVTVSNVNYGFKVDYSNGVTLENVDVTAAVAGILNSNYGEKTITIKDSEISILGTWTRNNTTKTTYVFEGANFIDKFIIDAAIDNFKLADANSTLTAPNEITVTTDVADHEVVYADGAYALVAINYVAQIDNTGYKTLADAIAAAKNGDVITLLADNDEDVTVVQAPDVAITIDGNDKTMSGTITVNGKSAAYATAGLTIRNVNFDATNISKDASINLGGNNNIRYTSNVTVENCKFVGTEQGKVAIKNYTGGCKNLTVTGCSATGMHSLAQVKGVAGVLVDNCTIADSENGISVGTSTNVSVSNSTIKTTGYGLRADGSGAYNMTVENCNITAELPIVVRKTSGAYNLSVNGGSLNGENEKGYGIIFTTGDDGSYEAPTSDYTVTVTGVDTKIFPDEANIARIGDITYDDLSDALAVAESGQTVVILKAYEEDMVIVPAGVTLDLNGQYLTAGNLLSFGDVIDSTDGVGGVKISNDTTKAFFSLQASNGAGMGAVEANMFIPLYDSQNGCYRLYEGLFKMIGVGGRASDASKVVYHVAYTFKNSAAYTLIANNEDTGMSIQVGVEWTGREGNPLISNISRASIKKHAENMLENGNGNYSITFTVNGLGMLNEGETVTLKAPSLKTTSGATSIGADKVYTVPAK